MPVCYLIKRLFLNEALSSRDFLYCIVFSDAVCLILAGMLFQAFAPLYENRFCPFDVFFIGIFRFLVLVLHKSSHLDR